MKKLGYPLDLSVGEEFLATMAAAVNDIKMNDAASFPVGTLQFVRLVDRHLRILVAMNQQ